jgi:hypothetical protein
VAGLSIVKVEESDFDDEFQLDVTNDHGKGTIRIQLVDVLIEPGLSCDVFKIHESGCWIT